MAGTPTNGSKVTTRRKRRAKITTQDTNNAVETVVSESASDEVDRPDLAMVTDADMESPHVKEYVRDLAFMEDLVTIVVGETTDKNAVNPVPVGVNGEIRLFTRGQEYTVQRKFVESLIKRENTISTKQYKDNEGCDQTKILSNFAMKYPVSIINDPAGEMGHRWFRFACENAF